MRRLLEVIQTVRDMYPDEIDFPNIKIILLQLWRHSYTASYHIYDFNSRSVIFAQDIVLTLFCNEMTFH